MLNKKGGGSAGEYWGPGQGNSNYNKYDKVGSGYGRGYGDNDGSINGNWNSPWTNNIVPSLIGDGPGPGPMRGASNNYRSGPYVRNGPPKVGFRGGARY